MPAARAPSAWPQTHIRPPAQSLVRRRPPSGAAVSRVIGLAGVHGHFRHVPCVCAVDRCGAGLWVRWSAAPHAVALLQRPERRVRHGSPWSRAAARRMADHNARRPLWPTQLGLHCPIPHPAPPPPFHTPLPTRPHFPRSLSPLPHPPATLVIPTFDQARPTMARTGYTHANGTGKPPRGYPRTPRTAATDANIYAAAQAAVGGRGQDLVVPPPDQLGQLGPISNHQPLGMGGGPGFNTPPPSPGLLGTLPFSMSPIAPNMWGGQAAGAPAIQQYNPVHAFVAGSLHAVGCRDPRGYSPRTISHVDRTQLGGSSMLVGTTPAVANDGPDLLSPLVAGLSSQLSMGGAAVFPPGFVAPTPPAVLQPPALLLAQSRAPLLAQPPASVAAQPREPLGGVAPFVNGQSRLRPPTIGVAPAVAPATPSPATVSSPPRRTARVAGGDPGLLPPVPTTTGLSPRRPSGAAKSNKGKVQSVQSLAEALKARPGLQVQRAPRMVALK